MTPMPEKKAQPLPPGDDGFSANEAADGSWERTGLRTVMARKRGRPKTGVKEPWKALEMSKATYYRRIRML